MFAKSSFVALPLFASSALAGKRGLAWPWYNSPLDAGVLNNGNGDVVAIYDWETYSPPDSKNNLGGLGWIGMQGCKDCDSSPLSQLQSRASAAGWATVFSVNEPDMPGSTNAMSPGDAASWYQTNINPLAVKKALPAVTSSATSGQGLDWLSQMISACGGNCYYDYINLHWYGTAFSDFQSHVNDAHSRWPDKQIVITEFALTNGGDQVSFFTQAFGWLDSQDFVELYFPFVATSPSLLSSNDGNAASYVGTGSCLFNDDGSPSAVGNLMFQSFSKRDEVPKREFAAWK